jgi:hypothetical protein
MSKIDQKFIDNLQTFTKALENVVELLEAQQKETKGTGDIANQLLKNIDGEKLSKIVENVEYIAKTSKKTLSNTEKILTEVKAIKKAKENGGVFQTAGSKEGKKSIVDGVKMIVLMAVGVLAIGMAFKIIGKVDFFSVIALGAGMVAVAYAYSKIAQIKPALTLKQTLMISLILPLMSLGLVASSYILQAIAPMSLSTFASIFLTGLSLVPMAFAFKFVLGALKSNSKNKTLAAKTGSEGAGGKDVGLKDIVFAALAIPLMAAGLVAASYILQGTAPMSLSTFLSVILVGIALIPIAFAFKFIVQALKSKKSSSMINKVMSEKSSESSEGINMKDLLFATMAIPLLAAGIVVASYILNEFQPLDDPWGLIVSGTAMAIAIAEFALVLKIVGKVGVGQLAKGALGIVIISAAIMISSLILNLGTYEKYPSLEWALGVGLSVGLFAGAAFVLGWMVMGPQLMVMLAGIAATLVVSATIVAASYILAAGTYDKYPTLDWVTGVGLALTTFVLVMMAAGGMALISSITSLFGGSDDIFTDSLLKVVDTIIAVATKFNSIPGTFNVSNVPSEEWAAGVGGAIASFAAAIDLVNAESNTDIFRTIITMGIYSAGDKTEQFKTSMMSIAETVVAVGKVFDGTTKFATTGIPSEEWAKGVAGSIASFATAIAAVNKESNTDIFRTILSMGIYSAGDKSEQFNSTMISLANTLIKVGEVFKGTDTFSTTGIPSEEWAEGVGGSIASFGTAIGAIGKTVPFVYVQDPDTGEYVLAPILVMKALAKGIIDVGEIFNANKMAFNEDNTPSEDWSSNVGGALSAWASAMTDVNATTKKSFATAIQLVGGSMEPMATSLVAMAEIFNASTGFEDTKTPSETWSTNVSTAISAIGKSLADIDTDDIDDKISSLMGFFVTEGLGDIITELALSIDQLALSLANLTDSGSSKLTDLATGLAILSAVDVGNMYSAIDAVIDSKEDLNAIFDDSSFMYYMDKIASGVGIYGGESAITKERDEYMKDLLNAVKNIDTNVTSIAGKSTTTTETTPNETKPKEAENFLSDLTDSISDLF